MNLQKSLKVKAWVVVCALTFVAGCWGPVWPHRRFTVDLAAAKASIVDVKEVVTKFLVAHQCVYDGKGGYDALRNTNTILDYKCQDGLAVSTGSNRNGGVLVTQVPQLIA